MKIGERQAQIGGAEVGPQHVDEAELGVGALPEQEVGEPFFAAGANEEVDVGGLGGNWGLTAIRNLFRNWRLPPRRQQAPELLSRGRTLLAPCRRRARDRVARRIVDGDS